MKKSNQKGFSPVIVLLIIILLVLVGFVAWYVWDKQNSKRTIQTQQTASSTTQSSTPASTQNTPDQQKYLVIKEWGVQIPLNDQITDANYYINDQGNAAIYKTSFAEISATCKTTPSGTVVRFTDPNMHLPSPFEAQTFGQRYGTNTKIGSYYYGYISPQSTCGSTDSPTDQNPSYQSQTSALTAIKFAIQNIKSTN